VSVMAANTEMWQLRATSSVSPGLQLAMMAACMNAKIGMLPQMVEMLQALPQ